MARRDGPRVGRRSRAENEPRASAEGVTMRPVLSLFPGAGLLDRGFELAGFCVVRGPDVIFGQDIRAFRPTSGHFEGVIGGPPCQDFSRARRVPPSGYGKTMLGEFARCVTEAAPDWWLMENVPGVPSVTIPGWVTQRFNLMAAECGGQQRRNRTFQFGSRDGVPLIVRRDRPADHLRPAALAKDCGRNFADLCELQGLPRDFDLPGLTREGKVRAVGNGVPVYMARRIAEAIQARHERWKAVQPAQPPLFPDLETTGPSLCECGCGRPVTGNQRQATVACRKRCERRRKGEVVEEIVFE